MTPNPRLPKTVPSQNAVSKKVHVLLVKSIPNHDALIHLACISNDPSFELTPNLGKSINLDALCKRYRIDNSKRTQHTALIDCDLLAKVYINLIDQKEPTLNFQETTNQYQKKDQVVLDYYKKIIKPSEKELKNHSAYLNNYLKKNFFN